MASPFDPPYPPLTVGVLRGGTAGNILARECEALFDLRTPPGLDPMAVLAPFLAEVESLDAPRTARAPAAGARLVLPGRQLDGASLARLIAAEGVTVAVGVPTVWMAVLEAIEAN